MSPESVQEYAEVMRERYQRATRAERGLLLDEFCRVTGRHRKSAIRLLRSREAAMAKPRQGRPPVYGVTVVDALVQLWEASDWLCSKRLVGVLPTLLDALERHGEVLLAPEVRAALLHMSPATIDRRLAAYRRHLPRRPYTQGPSAAHLKALIPIRTFGEWEGVKPGAYQIDLVAHCGESTHGFYLTSLTMVDVGSGWTEPEVVWGKDYLHVSGAVAFVRKRLPVRIRELHFDNGGEFLNHALYDYCRAAKIQLSRGRPYKKNDQAYVEQKNGAVIRRWVGYDRYASQAAFAQMQRLYRALRLYLNFFQPLQKLTTKQRDGAKVTKKYDAPQTPYQRLLKAKALTAKKQQELAALFLSLNPAALRREIAAALDALLHLAEGTARQALGNRTSEATKAVG